MLQSEQDTRVPYPLAGQALADRQGSTDDLVHCLPGLGDVVDEPMVTSSTGHQLALLGAQQHDDDAALTGDAWQLQFEESLLVEVEANAAALCNGNSDSTESTLAALGASEELLEISTTDFLRVVGGTG
eukprot:jgi/Mesvir1/2865/Mv13949-RA.1